MVGLGCAYCFCFSPQKLRKSDGKSGFRGEGLLYPVCGTPRTPQGLGYKPPLSETYFFRCSREGEKQNNLGAASEAVGQNSPVLFCQLQEGKLND